MASPRPVLYLVSGVAMLAASAVSLLTVLRHLVDMRCPDLQKHICRTVLLVPVYAGCTWISVSFPEQKLWLLCVRDCYTAVALISLWRMLLYYIGGERRLAISLEMHETVQQPWPLRMVWRPVHTDAAFLRTMQQCVMQYSVLRPVTSVLTLIATGMSAYHEWFFGLWDTFVYLFLATVASTLISAYYASPHFP